MQQDVKKAVIGIRMTHGKNKKKIKQLTKDMLEKTKMLKIEVLFF